MRAQCRYNECALSVNTFLRFDHQLLLLCNVHFSPFAHSLFPFWFYHCCSLLSVHSFFGNGWCERMLWYGVLCMYVCVCIRLCTDLYKVLLAQQCNQFHSYSSEDRTYSEKRIVFIYRWTCEINRTVLFELSFVHWIISICNTIKNKQQAAKTEASVWANFFEFFVRTFFTAGVLPIVCMEKIHWHIPICA